MSTAAQTANPASAVTQEGSGWKIYACIGAVIFIWSANYVIAKAALREFPPLLLMSIRMAISGLIMLPFLWKELKTSSRALTGKQWITLFVLGIFGVMGNQFFFVLGISKTTVMHTSMIIATSPVWVLLIAAVMGMERVTVPKVVGMGVAIAGIAILQVFRAKPSRNGPTIEGDLFALCAAILFALMTAFSKRYNPGRNSITLNSIGYIGGGILLLPVGWWSTRTFDLHRVSPAAWAGVFYMAAFSSVIAYLLFYWVLERIPASRIITYQYLQPFLATLLAVMLIGEELTIPAIASGALIIGGVLLAERSSARENRA